MDTLKNILVTGGAGYIGSHTVVELIQKGYHPIILDDLRNSNEFIINRIEKITGAKITLIKAECQDKALLNELFSKYKFEGVIHFAADKAVGESVENPLKYYNNNLTSLINILEMIQTYDVKSIVFSSSCSVYGVVEDVTTINEETKELKPNSPYANTKLISEQIINDWINATNHQSAALLRYFNPIGAHHSGEIGELPLGVPNNLLPFIMQTAIGKREVLTVFGDDYATEDGTCIRDYIHVTDLAKAHVSALDWLSNQANKTIEIFNIGTGKGSSVLEVINTFNKIINQPLNWKFGTKRPGDVPVIYANTEKSKKLLNWSTKLTIEDAIRDAWKWEQNLLKND